MTMKKPFMKASKETDNSDLKGVRLLELETPEAPVPESDAGPAGLAAAKTSEQEQERVAENKRLASRKLQEENAEEDKKKPSPFEDFTEQAGFAASATAAKNNHNSGKGPSGLTGEPSSDGSGLGPGAGSPGGFGAAPQTGSGHSTYGLFRNEWLSPRATMNNNPGLRWWVDDMLEGVLRQKGDSNIVYIKHGISHRQTAASGKVSQLLQARAQQIAAEMEADPGKHRRFNKYKNALNRIRVTDNHLMAKGWRIQEQKAQTAQASAKAPVPPA